MLLTYLITGKQYQKTLTRDSRVKISMSKNHPI